MQISRNMEKSLNDQIALEAYASTSYLSMASWCEVTGYAGAASFFYAQSDEERQHMLKIVHHLNEIGVPAKIPATKQPPTSYASLESIIKLALKSEQTVSKAINSAVDLALKEKDHASYAFLEWYVTEQTHEEAKFEAILQKFDLIGRDKLAINEIDKYLGSMTSAEKT
ncbi:MAG: ferritin [Candidatus Nitrosotenuis sp.]